MKIKFYSLFSIISLSLASFAQGVGINETGAAPDASAGLDVDFNNKGFLPPRMTTAQRNSISNPVDGLTIFNLSTGCLQWFFGGIWVDACSGPTQVVNVCNPSKPTDIVDVTNGATGKTWMDRNLGANRAATSSTDAESYGSLFQWGRFADGHQCVNRYAGDGVTTSATTTTLSNSDTPGHGDFILRNSGSNDWRSPRNDNLWQGTGGTNNPCPTSYRLPTETELNAERLSWSSNNSAGAFASPLKLPLAGYRLRSDGLLLNVGNQGGYWSSTVSSVSARYLYFNSSTSLMLNFFRANGFSVRCIKD